MNFEEKHRDFIENKVCYKFHNTKEVRMFLDELNAWGKHRRYSSHRSMLETIYEDKRGIIYHGTHVLLFKPPESKARDVYYIDCVNSIEVELI